MSSVPVSHPLHWLDRFIPPLLQNVETSIQWPIKDVCVYDFWWDYHRQVYRFSCTRFPDSEVPWSPSLSLCYSVGPFSHLIPDTLKVTLHTLVCQNVLIPFPYKTFVITGVEETRTLHICLLISEGDGRGLTWKNPFLVYTPPSQITWPQVSATTFFNTLSVHSFFLPVRSLLLLLEVTPQITK